MDSKLGKVISDIKGFINKKEYIIKLEDFGYNISNKELIELKDVLLSLGKGYYLINNHDFSETEKKDLLKIHLISRILKEYNGVLGEKESFFLNLGLFTEFKNLGEINIYSSNKNYKTEISGINFIIKTARKFEYGIKEDYRELGYLKYLSLGDLISYSFSSYNKGMFESKDILKMITFFKENDGIKFSEFINILKEKNTPLSKNIIHFLKSNKIIEEVNNSNLKTQKMFAQSNYSNDSIQRYINLFDLVINNIEGVENKFKKAKITFGKNEIKEKAIMFKKSDVYHSTTIEGYSVTEDMIDSILYGKGNSKYSPDQIENIVVVKGYSIAFDYLLKSFEEKQGKIDNEYIRDFYQKMWSESFKINNLSQIYQRSYRGQHKIMRGVIGYSMPEARDIFELVEIFCEKINNIENPISKAIVGHFLFAPIQAFEDGNGRISRFIMNFFLLSNSYNYLTITDHDYRFKYLSSYGQSEEILLKTFEEFYGFIYNQIK